jgi:hypothetical protein
VSLAICVFISWIVIIVFSLIPKKFSEQDMVFLFFVNTIFQLSIFTILHVNLKWLYVSRTVEHSLADLVCRLIMIPLVFVITANILLYSWKVLKWIIVVAIILSFLLLGQLLSKLGVLSMHHWNAFYGISLFTSYAIFSSFMGWFISNVDEKEVKVK